MGEHPSANEESKKSPLHGCGEITLSVILKPDSHPHHNFFSVAQIPLATESGNFSQKEPSLQTSPDLKQPALSTSAHSKEPHCQPTAFPTDSPVRGLQEQQRGHPWPPGVCAWTRPPGAGTETGAASMVPWPPVAFFAWVRKCGPLPYDFLESGWSGRKDSGKNGEVTLERCSTPNMEGQNQQTSQSRVCVCMCIYVSA